MPRSGSPDVKRRLETHSANSSVSHAGVRLEPTTTAKAQRTMQVSKRRPCISWAFILSLSRKRCTAKCAKRAVRKNTMILWCRVVQGHVLHDGIENHCLSQERCTHNGTLMHTALSDNASTDTVEKIMVSVSHRTPRSLGPRSISNHLQKTIALIEDEHTQPIQESLALKGGLKVLQQPSWRSDDHRCWTPLQHLLALNAPTVLELLWLQIGPSSVPSWWCCPLSPRSCLEQFSTGFDLIVLRVAQRKSTSGD